MLQGIDLGIDLGSQQVRFVTRDGQQHTIPSVIAFRESPRGRHTEATGARARDMLGRTSEDITVVRPIRAGLIADFPSAELFLKDCLREVSGGGLRRPSLLVTVPTDSKDLERRALQECLRAAGAGKIFIVPSVLASGIGAELPVLQADASALIDVGAERTRMAIFSVGQAVSERSVRTGGEALDGALASSIRRDRKIWISRSMAEALKARVLKPSVTRVKVRGRELSTGNPKTIMFSRDRALVAIEPVISRMEETIVSVLQNTPPELCGDLLDRGIILCGGLAPLQVLSGRFRRATGLAVLQIDTPEACTARGLASLMTDKILWEHVVAPHNT